MEKLYLVGYPYSTSLSLISLFNSPPYLPDLLLRFFGKLELNPGAVFNVSGLKTLPGGSQFVNPSPRFSTCRRMDQPLIL
jgi:hypothetical protein